MPTNSTPNLIAAPLLGRNKSYEDDAYQMAEFPSRTASPALHSPGGYVNVSHHDQDEVDIGGHQNSPAYYQPQPRF